MHSMEHHLVESDQRAPSTAPQTLVARKEVVLAMFERVRSEALQTSSGTATPVAYSPVMARPGAEPQNAFALGGLLESLMRRSSSSGVPTVAVSPQCGSASQPAMRPPASEQAYRIRRRSSDSAFERVKKEGAEGWSEELEFLYQLLHSEEIHQLLATADAAWDSTEDVKHKLVNKDVRLFIRAIYGNAQEEDEDEEAEAEVPELVGLDEVQQRLKGSRRLSLARASGANSHKRSVAQSPSPAPGEREFDRDLGALELHVDALARATPSAAARLRRWQERIAAADDTVSLFELKADVADPLTCIACIVFARHGLHEAFGIGHARLSKFCAALNGGYRSENAFHNELHAADVLYALHVLLHAGSCVERLGMEPAHVLSTLLSAMVHDFRHPGLTNSFLVSAGDPLAVLYNDRSVLESFHLAEAFKLMQEPALSLLHMCDAKQYREVRGAVIRMVLATDMVEHFAHVTELLSTAPTPKLGAVQLSQDGSASALGSQLESAQDQHISRERLLCILLHAGDISHPFRGALDAHVEWSNRLRAELFAQGDMERKRAMAISPMCDREQASGATFAASQIGFLDAVVQPLLEGLCMHMPLLRSKLTANLERARQYWKAIVLPEMDEPRLPQRA